MEKSYAQAACHVSRAPTTLKQIRNGQQVSAHHSAPAATENLAANATFAAGSPWPPPLRHNRSRLHRSQPMYFRHHYAPYTTPHTTPKPQPPPLGAQVTHHALHSTRWARSTLLWYLGQLPYNTEPPNYMSLTTTNHHQPPGCPHYHAYSYRVHHYCSLCPAPGVLGEARR